MQPPPKAIPKNLSRYQSRALVWIVGSILTVFVLFPLTFLKRDSHNLSLFLYAGVIALTFGLLVWVLRAATPAAAFFGAIICHILTFWTAYTRGSLFRSALTPLIILFILTFLATRAGKRRRPEFTSLREKRRGRSASQVIANLSVAALVIPGGIYNWYDWTSPHISGLISASVYIMPALLLAALAEATADTLSSELGQAFGGTPYLLTTLGSAAPGTDGAVSLLGTTAGLLGAALVIATGAWSMHLDLRQTLTALAGATAGLFFDSLLGATVERRGWLNNDLVNFSSTAFAALTTLLLLAL